jgi:hypothetical protein
VEDVANMVGLGGGGHADGLDFGCYRKKIKNVKFESKG